MLEREFREADRRIRLGIERNYIFAMAKLECMTPEEYAAKLDREAEEERIRSFRNQAEQLGYAYGVMARSLNEAAEGIARGWAAAFDRV